MNLWLHIVTHPAYLLACVLVAIAGRKRRSGFFGYLVMSFFFTPLIMLFVVYVGGVPPEPTQAELQAEAEALAVKAEKAAERARAKANSL